MDMILDEIISDHKLVFKKKSTIIAATAAAGEDHLHEDQDLVDVLLQLQESSDLQFQLTTDHIKAVIMEMYSTGSETSASTIEWTISELMKNPRAMEKAQAEIRQVVA
ncbi:putative 5-epiaristolochene 1,3-dihydroxylase [Rosa chinensis]|uniref:Putative 5-epiaristolochene 1,3-dihydroxylase n=1 Tax=Rosa chinensis TaxID=74649 RepID=A0A2P6R518_ROSCH|nr:cytochrome P450 71D8 [Rosa chinensis]PRQ41524.1 putative 5-epiaristolochene 1,3-dihydroxylase [Rosa chinensis]